MFSITFAAIENREGYFQKSILDKGFDYLHLPFMHTFSFLNKNFITLIMVDTNKVFCYKIEHSELNRCQNFTCENTVKLVYNDHPRDPKFVAVVERSS